MKNHYKVTILFFLGISIVQFIVSESSNILVYSLCAAAIILFTCVMFYLEWKARKITRK